MLYAIGVTFLVLWLLGFVTAFTLHGFIHVALVVGVVLIVAGLISRTRLTRR